MKSSNDTIGDRTHDLPVCSSVSQPTVPLRAPLQKSTTYKFGYKFKPLCAIQTLSPRVTVFKWQAVTNTRTPIYCYWFNY